LFLISVKNNKEVQFKFKLKITFHIKYSAVLYYIITKLGIPTIYKFARLGSDKIILILKSI